MTLPGYRAVGLANVYTHSTRGDIIYYFKLDKAGIPTYTIIVEFLKLFLPPIILSELTVFNLIFVKDLKFFLIPKTENLSKYNNIKQEFS